MADKPIWMMSRREVSEEIKNGTLTRYEALIKSLKPAAILAAIALVGIIITAAIFPSANYVYDEDGLRQFGQERFNAEMVGYVSNKRDQIAVWYGNDGFMNCAVFNIKGKDKYEYAFTDLDAHKYRDGIYSAMMLHGFTFYVNDPECTEILAAGAKENDKMYITEYPFIGYWDMSNAGEGSLTFYYLDKDKNVLAKD